VNQDLGENVEKTEKTVYRAFRAKLESKARVVKLVLKVHRVIGVQKVQKALKVRPENKDLKVLKALGEKWVLLDLRDQSVHRVPEDKREIREFRDRRVKLVLTDALLTSLLWLMGSQAQKEHG
jgi:hypothetical protein